MKRARGLAGLLAVAVTVGAAACGGGTGSGDARYPKRPEGCAVAVYPETPEVATDNIGPVYASCTEDVAAEDCLRTLKDQVCKLGGDVAWGVGEPERNDGHVIYRGRAAHTKGKRGTP